MHPGISSRAEDCLQVSLLETPFEEDMSGRIRYAAAMYFYQRGMISEACLEVYRTCSRLDREDPVPFLKSVGLVQEVEALKSNVRKEAP